MNEWINEKLLPPVLKFVNTKAITSVTNKIPYGIYDLSWDSQ
ncbi:hypothetical protein [Enterococcus faecalis]|nr:hypothetical protein [Enterococcus faecalis]